MRLRGWFKRWRARRVVPWSAVAWNPHDFARRQRDREVAEIMREQARNLVRFYVEVARANINAQADTARAELEAAKRRAAANRRAIDLQREIYNRGKP